VSVRLLSIAKIFFQRFHRVILRFSRSALSLTSAGSLPAPADAILGDFYQNPSVSQFGSDRV
jgi:hypothetical protein